MLLVGGWWLNRVERLDEFLPGVSPVGWDDDVLCVDPGAGWDRWALMQTVAEIEAL